MSKTSNSGVGLSGLVFLVFLALKLAGIGVVATWSWWWITSPLWIPVGLVLAGAVVYVSYHMIKDAAKRR